MFPFTLILDSDFITCLFDDFEFVYGIFQHVNNLWTGILSVNLYLKLTSIWLSYSLCFLNFAYIFKPNSKYLSCFFLTSKISVYMKKSQIHNIKKHLPNRKLSPLCPIPRGHCVIINNFFHPMEYSILTKHNPKILLFNLLSTCYYNFLPNYCYCNSHPLYLSIPWLL